MRAKVEHPFLIVKRDFGFTKTRYRGITKNLNRLHMRSPQRTADAGPCRRPCGVTAEASACPKPPSRTPKPGARGPGQSHPRDPLDHPSRQVTTRHARNGSLISASLGAGRRRSPSACGTRRSAWDPGCALPSEHQAGADRVGADVASVHARAPDEPEAVGQAAYASLPRRHSTRPSASVTTTLARRRPRGQGLRQARDESGQAAASHVVAEFGARSRSAGAAEPGSTRCGDPAPRGGDVGAGPEGARAAPASAASRVRCRSSLSHDVPSRPRWVPRSAGMQPPQPCRGPGGVVSGSHSVVEGER